MERTFVYLKPDAVRRGLVGEIIGRFEKKGLKIVALKLRKMKREEAEELYKEHKGKVFFERLIDFVTSSPVVLMVLEGPNAVHIVRHTVGATDPLEAAPGSIRGDFAVNVTKNLVHASDSVESAKREMFIFFNESELESYNLPIEKDLVVEG